MGNKTKFYTFHQNNSGGYYILDENVQHYVIIEGYDLWQIESFARKIFEDYRDYCPCCGQRWDDSWMDEDDMTDEPKIYGKDVHEYKNNGCKAIIYYLDGRKEIVDLGTDKGEIIHG